MKKDYCYEHERDYPCIECQERDEMTKSWYEQKQAEREYYEQFNETYYPESYEEELEENE